MGPSDTCPEPMGQRRRGIGGSRAGRWNPHCRHHRPGVFDVDNWKYSAQIGVVATEARRRDWAFAFYRAEKGLGQHHHLTEREKTKALASFVTSINETTDSHGTAGLSVTVEAEIEPEARRKAQALFAGITHVGRLTLEAPSNPVRADGTR